MTRKSILCQKSPKLGQEIKTTLALLKFVYDPEDEVAFKAAAVAYPYKFDAYTDIVYLAKRQKKDFQTGS
jgi:hypothetical protein